MPWHKCLEFCVGPISSVGLADKIEYRETIFLWSVSQTSPQLLKEDGQAFGRSEEENGVHLWHVDTLAKLVDSK